MAALSGLFGLVAVVLAMTGLYGVVWFMVARRRNELGIRMALGAQRADVVGLVMGEASALLLVGIVTETALSLLAGRWASSLLFYLKPYDPLTLITASALLGGRGFGEISSGATLCPNRPYGGAQIRIKRPASSGQFGATGDLTFI